MGGQVHIPACHQSLTEEGLLVPVAESWVNLHCQGEQELPSPSAWGTAHVSSGNFICMGESLGPEDIAETWDTSSACCLPLCGASYLLLMAFVVFKVC